MDAESVVTSTELSLAFNNTKVAVRDGEGVLHLVWKDGNDLRYGHQRESGSWTIQSLASAGPGAVLKPTITLVGGGTLLISWSEQGSLVGQNRWDSTSSVLHSRPLRIQEPTGQHRSGSLPLAWMRVL